jgi:hypothetical protein
MIEHGTKIRSLSPERSRLSVHRRDSGPGLLVSFRSVEEVASVDLSQVDVVDLKNPSRGALAPVDWPIAQDVFNYVGQRAIVHPVSLALGELRNLQVEGFQQLSWPVAFAKAGLSGMSSRDRWQDAWNASFILKLPDHVSPVAVAYADYQSCDAPCPEEIITAAIDFGVSVMLIDTFDKRLESSIDLLGIERLINIRKMASQQGIQFVLAGRINVRNLRAAVRVEPDLIAVRGAVTNGQRDGDLSRQRLDCFARKLLRERQALTTTIRQTRDAIT